MSSAKHSTQFPGVRYRVHKSRKHNGNKYDQYFFIRYRVNGKLKEEGIGWASAGWNATKASLMLAELKRNHLTGEGPKTLEEKRFIEDEKRKEDATKKERIERELISIASYFENKYFPESKANKVKDSWSREDSLFRLWINQVIGKMPFKDIRPFHLERIKKNMNDTGKAPRSIQYALAVVRQVFNHAFKNEMYFGDNPVRKVKMPALDNKRIRFLNHNEADALLAELKNRRRQLHDIALISLHCGLRAGEIFKLTWGDIDFTNEIISVKGKGNKTRPALMTEEVKEIFTALPSSEPYDLVFKDHNGMKIDSIPKTFKLVINNLEFNKGISDDRHKVVFHTLRHTFASWLVQNGVDLYTVQKLMGHSTISMTERYAHLAQDNLKSAVKKLEESMKRQRSAEVVEIPTQSL
jgi:integrase